MIEITDGIIGAYHNYIVNDMPIAGFVLDDPKKEYGFWFVADLVNSGDALSLISGYLFNRKGRPLVKVHKNRILQNPGDCVLENSSEGFGIYYPDGEILLTAETVHFANGHITYLRGEIFDHKGVLRMKSFSDSIQVYGSPFLLLDKPFKFSKE